VSGYPNLAMSKVKIEQEIDSLCSQKTLSLVSHNLSTNVNHLAMVSEKIVEFSAKVKYLDVLHSSPFLIFTERKVILFINFN